jgi:Activator of Hsp90 ATPase homolog 1-like protein
MKSQNFTTTITVDQAPEEVFAAINDVAGWWSGKPGVEGKSGKVGDEFTYRYEPHHVSTQRVTELIPGKKVAWLVVSGTINFAKDKTEWNGTTITFDITRKGKKTAVRFTHAGLTPDVECYDGCSDAWSSYIKGSLKNRITQDKARRTAPDEPARKASQGRTAQATA